VKTTNAKNIPFKFDNSMSTKKANQPPPKPPKTIVVSQQQPDSDNSDDDDDETSSQLTGSQGGGSGGQVKSLAKEIKQFKKSRKMYFFISAIVGD
jgi:hypothetical protein